MVKWKLMISTLPYVAVVLAIKMGAERFFGFQGVLAVRNRLVQAYSEIMNMQI